MNFFAIIIIIGNISTASKFTINYFYQIPIIPYGEDNFNC